jgi:hypothetical protein
MSGLLIISLLLAQVSSGISSTAHDFPTSAAAFEVNSIVTVDSRTLESLTDGQLRALLQFSGSCGRVLLVDVSATVERLFRDDAACDGRYLHSIEAADDRNKAALLLGQLENPKRLSSEELEALLVAVGDGRFGLKKIVWFWSAYVLLAAALLTRRRTRIAALGFSFVASLLVPVVWPASPSRVSVAWAEAEADDRVVAFFLREQDGTEIIQQRGSFDLNPSLGISIDDSKVTICNYGNGASDTTHVYWHGSIFALPALDPGGRWTSDRKLELGAAALRTPELSLFSKRSREFDLSFLRPLPAPNSDDQAWLLQYVSSEQMNRPCDL